MVRKIRNFISLYYSKSRDVILSILPSASIACACYLGFFQRHFFSFRYAAYAILIFILSVIFTGWFNKRILLPKIPLFFKPIRDFILLVSFLLSLFLLLNTRIQPVYYFLPDSRLEIQFSIPKLPNEEEGVRLLWVRTGQDFVHYSNIQVNGEWERVFGNSVFYPGQEVNLHWSGKAGAHSEIAFRQTNFIQRVTVTWDGESKTYRLDDPKTPIIYIRHQFSVPFIYQLPFILSFIVAVFYLISTLLVITGSFNIPKLSSGNNQKWLLFMLPMVIIWLFTLLIFWPGIMSNDSLAQWIQGVTGEYNDWQSAFHALVLAGLMKVWYSPAIVVIIQILLLSLTIAWGLKILEEQSVPQSVCWSISILFAIFPTNGILSITVWKDVMYAIAFLWLVILLLKIYLSDGLWAVKKYRWLILGIAGFFVSIFRQNGVAVTFLSLCILPIIYRKYWKSYTASLIISCLLFLIVKGPVYNYFKVDRSRTGQTSLIYLHHIAAHLHAGTEIQSEDKEYLNTFMPVEDWDYWCCYVGTISYDGDFDRESFLANTALNRRLAFKLFLENPLIDIQHAFCAGELTWKFANNKCYMKSTHGINRWQTGRVDWIGRNKLDLKDKSYFPELLDPYVLWLRRFGFLDNMLVVYLRPAFWMMVAFISLSVAVVRRKDLTALTPGIPVFSQSIILLLVSFAPAFRYHYGTVLAGLFLLGLFFLPAKQNNKLH